MKAAAVTLTLTLMTEGITATPMSIGPAQGRMKVGRSPLTSEGTGMTGLSPWELAGMSQFDTDVDLSALVRMHSKIDGRQDGVDVGVV
jgi:hypothetical protein